MIQLLLVSTPVYMIPKLKGGRNILLAYGLKIEIKIYEKYLNALVIDWDATYFTNKNNVCYILIKGYK